MFSPYPQDPYVCGDCRRSFTGPGPLKLHQRTCQISKKCFRGVLSKAKEIWERKKKLHLELTASPVSEPGPSAQLSEDQLQIQVYGLQ